MITVNSILLVNGEKIVPVRAIPFVTGGDMGPKTLAGILADPDHCLFAFVLGPNGALTAMLPKNWKQYKDKLSVGMQNSHDLDLIDSFTLGILPPSTFVYWNALWRSYEANFLPVERNDIGSYPPAEQANFELQPNAILSKDLVSLVFEGFQATDGSGSPSALEDGAAGADEYPNLQGAKGEAQSEDALMPNFDLLATRDQLIKAFEPWGLNRAWFNDLNSHPWLKMARKIKGHGQRGNVTEPLFCPLAVMTGLVTSTRGIPRMRLGKGWDILDLHFPKVVQENSIGDPRERSG